METIAIPLLLLVGSLLAVQAAANVQLSTAMASPVGASALQLAIGATLLLALTAVAGALTAFELLDRAEPWHLRRRARQRRLHHGGHPAVPAAGRAGRRRALHRRADAGLAAARRLRLARPGP